LPDDVPVVRLMDAGLAAPMAEYALYDGSALSAANDGLFPTSKPARIWQPRDGMLARHWPVAFWSGRHGTAVAQRNAAHGYPVAG